MCLKKITGEAPKQGFGYKAFIWCRTVPGRVYSYFMPLWFEVGVWLEADTSFKLTFMIERENRFNDIKVPTHIKQTYDSGFHIFAEIPQELIDKGTVIYKVEYDEGTVEGIDDTLIYKGAKCIVAKKMKILERVN